MFAPSALVKVYAWLPRPWDAHVAAGDDKASCVVSKMRRRPRTGPRPDPAPARRGVATAAALIAALGLALAALIRMVISFAARRRPSLPPADDKAEPGSNTSRSTGTSGGTGAAAPPPEQARSVAESPSSRPSGGSGCLLLLLAIGCALLSIFAYTWLRDWHRPAHLTASASNLKVLQRLALMTTDGGAPAVHWHVAGSVRQLKVLGTNTGTAEIILPLARSNCPMMARKLKLPPTSCTGGGLSMSSPAEIAWSSAQFLTSGQMVSRRLDVVPSPGPASALRVALSAQTRSSPTICFSPQGAVTLRLIHSNGSYTKHMIASGSFRCEGGAGLAVLIGKGRAGSPPAFEFDGISSLTVSALGPAGLLQGFAGQVELKPGGKTVLASPTIVSLNTENNASHAGLINVGLSVGNATPGSQPLIVTSGAVTSVATNNGELVPSVWDTDNGFVAPFLGGFVTMLVLTPLWAAMQAFLDVLNRWARWLVDKLQRWRRRFTGKLKRWVRQLFRAARPIRGPKERHAP